MLFAALAASLALGGYAEANQPRDISADEIAAAVRADLDHEIRPGGVNGSPFWNGYSRFFMYPPAFDFPAVNGATEYRYEVVDAKGGVHVFTAPVPTASLKALWPELPSGWTTVTCFAITQKPHYRPASPMVSRCFWKQAPFTGDYPAAVRGYGEAARLAKAWLRNQDAYRKFLATGDGASCGYWGMTYPSKMVASIVRALTVGEPSGQDLAEARKFADWILSISEGADRPLAHFPPTYFKTTHENQAASTRYLGQVMLVYPAEVGEALVDLHAKTKEAKYLDAARNIAATYLRLQGEDGTWPLKMSLETGKEIAPNRLMPIGSVIPFLESLYGATGDARYRAAADRAFAYVENGPVRTWNWEGQFEDIEPDAAYRDLTKHDACATALYVLKRYPGDAKRLALARELLRFSEDQFVCWEKPFPDMPTTVNLLTVKKWTVPGALEQYYWYVPIDASASKLIRTYLALWRAEKNPLDLAKAKALGDSLTRMQQPDGFITTEWVDESWLVPWWNCLLIDVKVLGELERATQPCKAAPASLP